MTWHFQPGIIDALSLSVLDNFTEVALRVEDVDKLAELVPADIEQEHLDLIDDKQLGALSEVVTKALSLRS